MKPDKTAAHEHPWKISDVVMFPALILAIACEGLWPTRLLPLAWWLTVAAGAAVIVAGFVLIDRAKRELDRAAQPTHPGVPTTALVTTGPYRFSRNPNYLGAILIALGCTFVANSLWFLAVTVLSAVILELWMIRPEERYLKAAFGENYLRYMRATRRWL